MVRAIFWLVLLINLALFAIMKWGGALTRDEGALMAQPPLNVEKIKLLPPSAVEAPSAIAVPASAPAAAQPAPASAVQPGVPLPQPGVTPGASASAATIPAACLDWGEFSGSDLAHAREKLATLKLGDRLAQRQLEHSTGYWVYIPPLKTRAEVNKKIAQLKKRGVKQYFVVDEQGKWHNAISLGVFKSADLAQKFLAHLKVQGVKNAAAGERKAKLRFTVFMLKSPDATTLAKLADWQKTYTGIEMKSVSCN